MMAKCIKSWTKNTVECNWRTVHIEKICFTLIHCTFTYRVNSFEQTFFSAVGMKEPVKKWKLDSRVKSVRNSLPDGAADAMVLPENFDPKDITIEVTDDGDLAFMELYVITSKKCHMSETGFMQYFVMKYKALPLEDPKLADIMNNWDKIIAKYSGEMKHIDILGCILPHQKHIFASPNEQKFIACPVEHANSKCHKWTIVAPKLSPTLPLQPLNINVDTKSSSSITPPPLTSPKPLASSGKRSSPFLSPTSVKKQKMLTVGLEGTITVEKKFKVKNTKTSTDATITIKSNKRLTFKPINQLLDPTVQVLQDPASSAEKHAQNSCYSFVLSGCSKEVSNNTTVEFYDKHIDNLRYHHQEHLGHLEVDIKALPKPM